ncbi:MAG: hypothetical protein DRJ42_20220, partial [Deltaproteobacteria bacterium]
HGAGNNTAEEDDQQDRQDALDHEVGFEGAEGCDQENLVAALSALKAYFMVKGILAILVIVLFCCVVTGAMFMGAALASAFGNQ